MSRATKYLGLCIASALLAGCYSYEVVDVSNVKADAIHQDYRVYYDSEENQTLFTASFRVGGKTGSTLDLTGASAIECNGQQLGRGTFIGRRYGFEMPGHAADCEFVFTDAEGNRRVNTIRLGRTEFADDTPETLSRSKHHTLPFDGPPIADGEIVELEVVEDSTGATDAGERADSSQDDLEPLGESRERVESERVLARSSQVGGASVDVRADVLERMPNGPVTVQWTRIVERELQDAMPAGGGMYGRYQSSLRKITLTD